MVKAHRVSEKQLTQKVTRKETIHKERVKT